MQDMMTAHTPVPQEVQLLMSKQYVTSTTKHRLKMNINPVTFTYVQTKWKFHEHSQASGNV